MSTYIAFLRGINVGSRNRVSMAYLRTVFTALGFTSVRTWLQSGNVVFGSDGKSATELQRLLEVETASRLGMRVEYVVRTLDEMRRVVSSNPFPDAARDDPSHLIVMFLKAAPPAEAVDALRAAVRGREIVHVDGSDAYIVYPDGIGESKLTNALIDRKLGTIGTGRNWNTVLALIELASK